MPNWKKLIVSGSDASLNSLNVTQNVTAQSFTGSFTGSFTAPGATTQVVYNNNGVLSANSGFVYSGSYVGIGTTSPSLKFNVEDTAATYVAQFKGGNSTYIVSGDTSLPGESGLNARNSVGQLFLGISPSAEAYFSGTSGATALGFYLGGTNRIYINSTGNVGIGTTNPSQRLDVNGALVVGMTTPAPFWNALFKDFSDGSGIYISAVNGGGGKYIAGNGYYYNSTLWRSDKTTASAINLDNGTLIFYTNTGLTPNTNYTPTERMRVAADGNVGIGITNPGTTLDVVGNIQASNYLYGNVATITPLVLNVTAGDLTVENASVGYNLVLKTSGAERMRVTSVGDVGIGTFSPAAKLEVIGNVKATSFTGSLFGTASYAVYAIGAGAANSATSASYALSSSYALVATTASYAINALSSSYALSGSFSNFALTASYALNAGDSIWTGSGANIYYNLGNVGIGVTNPTYKLHVSSSNNNDGIAVHYPANNSTQFPFYVGDNSNGVYARLNATEFEFKRNGAGSTIKTVGSSNNLVLESANNLVFNTNGATTQMYINTSGNVGIGTISPLSKLQVRAGLDQNFRVASSTNLTVASINDADSAYAPITFRASTFDFLNGNVGIGTTAANYTLDVTGIGNFKNIGAQLVLNGGFGAYEFGTTTGNAFTISLSGTAERMRIDANGNVGINTLSPGDKLEVVGNVYADAFNSVGTLSRYNSTGGIAIAGLAGNPYAYISAYVNGAGAGKNLVLQPSSGSVGIGTTNPAATLEVSGNVKAVSFTGSFSGSINTAVSASYALSSSYALSGSYSNFALTASYALNAGDSIWTGSGTDIYYNQGNVGIGVTNPVSRLQVNKSSQTYSSPTASGALVLSNLAGGNAVLDIGVDATNLSYLQSRYINNTSVYQLLLNPGGGNIGIGTTNPAATLQINASTSVLRLEESSPSAKRLEFSIDSSAVAKISANQSAQSIAFETVGSERMRIDTNGNVGIGTTGPSSKLEVYTTTGDTKLTVTTTGGSSYVPRLSLDKRGDSAWNISSPAGGFNFAIDQDGSAKLWIASGTGNVGIGTTNPSSALDAIVSSGGTSGLRFRGYSDAATPYLLSLGTYSYPDQFQIKSVNGLVTMGIVGNTGANPDLAFQTNTTERMRITTGGNVGIGTTNPNAALNIVTPSGDSTGQSFVFKGYNGKEFVSIAKIGYIRTQASDINGANMHFADNSGTKRMEMSINGTSMNWYSDALAAEFLYFKHTTGNIGIGTASPTQKLDVAGAISVSGSVIDYEVAPALIGPGPAVNIVSFVPGTTKAAFVDYVIVDSSGATNQRVGTIMVSINLNTVSAVINEITTVDIGNTSAITFAVAYGAPTWLTATNSGITPYDISYMVRYF